MSDGPVPIYHLDLSATDGIATAFVNDFPVVQLSATAPREASVPLNPYLVGPTNRVRVDVRAHHGERVPKVEAMVLRFTKGSIVGPDGGEPVVRPTDWSPSVPVGPPPWQLQAKFASTDASAFANDLVEAKPLNDGDGIRDYAMHLCDLVEQDQRDALMAEMRPKVEAYARAYKEPPANVETSLAEVLKAELLSGRADLGVTRQALRLESVCGGRLCGVRRGDRRALLVARPDANGGVFSLEVFVGAVDGQYRVMR